MKSHKGKIGKQKYDGASLAVEMPLGFIILDAQKCQLSPTRQITYPSL